MGFLLIFVFIGLLGWANLVAVRLLRSCVAGPGWWASLVLLWIGGAAVGYWGGFFFEYQPSPRLRVLGAPIPAAFLHLEGPPGDEQWIDFITPAPLLFAGSNVIIVALLLACPLLPAFWLRHRAQRSDATRRA